MLLVYEEKILVRRSCLVDNDENTINVEGEASE